MILENLYKKLKKLAACYTIITVGQIISIYLAIVTYKTGYFNEIKSENFSIFIQKPLGHYLIVLLFWNLFTGFFIAIIIIPIIKFFHDEVPKFIWIVVLLGQLFLLKDAQYEKLFSVDFFRLIVQLIPAFLSLFVGIYFQSKR